MTSIITQDIFDGHLLDGDRNRIVIKFEPNKITVPRVNVLQVVGDGIELFMDAINDLLKIGTAGFYLLISVLKALPAVSIGALLIYSGQSQLLLLPFSVFKEVISLL